MEDGVDVEDLFGEDGPLKRMKKRTAERILEAELTDHLHVRKGHEHPRYPGHIEYLYGVSISPELDSRTTDTVTDEVLAWQSRPLDAVTRFCSWMPSSSRYVIAAASGTRRSTWPWAST